MIPDRNLRIAFVAALELVRRRQLEQLRRGNPDPEQLASALAGLSIPGDKLAKLRAIEWPDAMFAEAVGGAAITDLRGLERCTALEACRLRVAPGTRAAPLARLFRLSELAITGAALDRIEFVAKLRRLRTLGLDGPIDDLRPLAELDALESLSLDGIVATDVTPLLELRALAQLRLRWADGAPGPVREAAQAVVDALADTVEIDVVWPCGEVKPSREGARRARNPELEARIFADPDDPDAYLVYADWLQAESDPFGQLIIYDHHLAEAPSPELVEGRRAHLATHRRRILGDLDDSAGFQWRLGYIRRAEVANADELAKLWSAPAARFLTSLCLHVASPGAQVARYIAAYGGQVLRTLLTGTVKPLRELEVHTRRAPVVVTYQSVRASPLDLSSLWQRYPHLRRLVLDGPIELGEVVLPEATDVEVRDDGGLSDIALASVTAASWPNLERLVLAGLFDRVDPAFLEASAMPSLRRLRLEARWPDPICVALAGARVVDQLVELEVVSPEGVGNEGARALVRARRRFVHLTVFDVTVGKVNPADARALGEILVKRGPD